MESLLVNFREERSIERHSLVTQTIKRLRFGLIKAAAVCHDTPLRTGCGRNGRYLSDSIYSS